MMRLLLCWAGILVLCHHALGEKPSLRTQVALATYRLEHLKTSGTGFIVNRSGPADDEPSELLLVTTAHAFEKMDGDRLTLVLRRQDTGGDWFATPFELEIRQNGKDLWHRHPKHDVAVVRLPKSVPDHTASIPLGALASANDWEGVQPEPGMLIRCVGFPHAAQFKPSQAGFPLVRLGCVASYPLTPFEKHPTFMVDYNTFEGDSGGPAYVETTNADDPELKIIGLVHGQHFIDERYQLVYQSGHVRKRMGLAVVVNSQAILETIETLPQS